MQLLTDIRDFVEYCYKFYNKKDGMYPIATRDEIEFAVTKYILGIKRCTIAFDTFDREKVREIIGR